MSQQTDLKDLQLVGDFMVASHDPDTIHIAVVTGRKGVVPDIENLSHASAIAFMQVAIAENQKLIEAADANVNDKVIARNRLPALQTALRELKDLAPL